MTIIAWDGQTLAADKRATLSGLASVVTKIYEVPQGLLGVAGEFSRFGAILEWFREKDAAPKHCPKFQQDVETCLHIVLIANNGAIWKYECSGHPYLVEDVKFAMGSGRNYAIAAMECGKSAPEAVQIACKFDIYCGNGYDTLTLPVIDVPVQANNPSGGTEMARTKSESQELARKLRLTYHQADIAHDDHMLLQPLLRIYNEHRNAAVFNDKQSELILSIYNKYFES
jgi:ATP-dependent protease HslVU (ClpYQ) peptidase subunit